MNNSQWKYIFNGGECLLYSMKASGLDLLLNLLLFLEATELCGG